MRKLIIIAFSLFVGKLFSQAPVGDTALNIPMVSVHFSGQLPYGDMAKRFGENAAVGGSFIFKHRRTWTLGMDGAYFWGKKVRENVLVNMKNADGFVIDNEGFPADLRITERGFNAYVTIGKVFPKLGHNPNSGLIINLGFGYLQHKIKLYDGQQKIAAIKGDLKKGYDRLSGGPAMEQYIGYLYLSDNRLINFEVGFEFHEAITKSYRGFNYDTQMPDTQTRMDYLIGLRLGWVLPLYRRGPQKFYYN
jgi:hypothetical protein